MAKAVDNTSMEPRGRYAGRWDKLKTKTKNVALALHFEDSYEYSIKDGVVSLVDEDPLVRHSWTSMMTDSGQDVEKYRVGIANAYLPLPKGVTVILGKSGAGKTRLAYEHLFARAVLAGLPARYIRMAESGTDAFFRRVESDRVHKPTFEIEFAQILAEALTSQTDDLIIVDSLRYLFYSSSGGATGRGGVNMSLFMMMTHLDNVAYNLGKRLVVVINPLTDDSAAFSGYVEASVGAVSSVVVMETFDQAAISTRAAKNRQFTIVGIGPNTILSDGKNNGDGAEKVSMGGDSGRVNRSTVFGTNRGAEL